MRGLSVAVAAATWFALPIASSSNEFSVAAIETGNVGHNAKEADPAEGGQPAAEPFTPANPLWAIPVSKLSATRDRPLFAASRRPMARVAPAAPAPTQTISAPLPAAEKPPFTLVGTIIGADNRIAILFDEISKNASGLHEGERVSGWTLRSVGPLSATLEESGRLVTLELPRPDDKAIPAPHVSGAPSQGEITNGD